MQTGSSETLIGKKFGKTTIVPIWDRMKGALLPPLNISNTGVHIRALSVESLMEEHHWVLNQFVKISRRSIIVCFLSLSDKAG
jgi:hypothetical protein